MLFLLLAPLAPATGSGPMPTLTPVDAACEYDRSLQGALELTYTTRVQSCPPGGPCSEVSRTPRSTRFLRVEVRDCEGYLPGRFQRTGRTCDGAPVWRFTGRLPPGRDISIRGRATSVGWLTVAGEAGERCPATRKPRVRTTDAEPGEVVRQTVTLSAEAFTVMEQDGTRIVRWDGTVDGAPVQPQRPSLEGSLQASPEALDGRTGVLHTQAHRHLEKVKWPGYRECFAVDRVRRWLTVEGVEGEVVQTSERRFPVRDCSLK